MTSLQELFEAVHLLSRGLRFRKRLARGSIRRMTADVAQLKGTPIVNAKGEDTPWFEGRDR